jgi:class 3 adenylate cyclase
MKLKLAALLYVLWSSLSFAEGVKVQDGKLEYELFKGCERQIFDLNEDPGITAVMSMPWLLAEDLALDQKNTRSAYYLKATIHNQLDMQLISHIYYVSLNRTSIYQVLGGEVITSADLGIYSDQTDFPFLHSYPMLELKDTKGKPFDIILRVEGIQTAYIPWFVSALRPVFKIRHYQDLFFGIVYGLMLIVVIYNFSLYYRLREADNLIYAIWVLFIALHLAFFNGFIYEFLWPNLEFGKNFVDVIGAAAGILHILFAVVFLKVQWKRAAGRIAVGIIIWYAASAIVTLSNLSEAFFPWMNPVLIVMFEGLFCLVLGAAALYKGFKPALFFLLANIFFFIFIGAVVSYGTGNADHTFINYNGFQLGSALEVLFFSFGLSYKVRLLKKGKDDAMLEKTALALENEKMVLEQNIILEQKVKERTSELQTEKKRSEDLLLNILPEQTAQELKDTGKARPRRFEDVTILFGDFVGFTNMSETLNPEELVEMIDYYFSTFDEIMEKYGIEKIKTIGDAYMAAVNMPEKSEQGVRNIISAALEIRDFVALEARKNPECSFEIRIGLNTGSVVAGVVGSKKFQFDIWGDAVNVAARLEANCEPGKVNISKTTYNAVKDDFDCSSRGKIMAKNKGKIEMFYVLSHNEHS